MINLELTEKHNSAVWLHHNAAMEGLSRNIGNATAGIKRQIDDVNISRRITQEKEFSKIAKLMSKRQVRT